MDAERLSAEAASAAADDPRGLAERAVAAAVLTQAQADAIDGAVAVTRVALIDRTPRSRSP